MSWRENFYCPTAPARYFLSHSVGLRPKLKSEALQNGFLEEWRKGSSTIWDAWLDTLGRFRKQVAGTIGASENEICPQTNISSAFTKILHSLPRAKDRNRIVLSREDFPTIGFVAMAAKQYGFDVDIIDGGEALADPNHWTRALGEDVFLVHLTHVYSNSGLKSPVQEISERIKSVGAWCVVDAAQSAGVVPIDVAEWRADFVTGTSVKYLCGGPGAAWLWASPAASHVARPIDVGWFSHSSPFEFDIENFEYAPEAARFWGGTPSVAPYALATDGIETIRSVGVDRISGHVTQLIEMLVENLPENAIMSHVARGEHGAHIVLRLEEPERASAALTEQGLLHDVRAGGLRFSCHCYTDENDILALLEGVKAFLPK